MTGVWEGGGADDGDDGDVGSGEPEVVVTAAEEEGGHVGGVSFEGSEVASSEVSGDTVIHRDDSLPSPDAPSDTPTQGPHATG